MYLSFCLRLSTYLPVRQSNLSIVCMSDCFLLVCLFISKYDSLPVFCPSAQLSLYFCIYRSMPACPSFGWSVYLSAGISLVPLQMFILKPRQLFQNDSTPAGIYKWRPLLTTYSPRYRPWTCRLSRSYNSVYRVPNSTTVMAHTVLVWL